MKRLLILFLSASFLAGCSSGFVYQRKPDPVQDSPEEVIRRILGKP